MHSTAGAATIRASDKYDQVLSLYARPSAARTNAGIKLDSTKSRFIGKFSSLLPLLSCLSLPSNLRLSSSPRLPPAYGRA